MELSFSEIDNNDMYPPSKSLVNVPFDRYWETDIPEAEEKPAKKKVSFDDIMNNMNLVVSKTGVLQLVRSQTQSNCNPPQQQANYPPQQRAHYPPQNSKPVQITKQEHIEPAVKHSYIYNKYFKDYQDAVPVEPEVRVPKTKEEYFKMLREERMRQIAEKRRVSQIKSTKMLFTTNTGAQGNVQSSKNTLGKLNFH